MQPINWFWTQRYIKCTGTDIIFTSCSGAPMARGGLGRRDTGKIPGGPPGPVILIIIKMHKENKSREDRAAFFFFFPGRAGPLELPSPPLPMAPHQVTSSHADRHYGL